MSHTKRAKERAAHDEQGLTDMVGYARTKATRRYASTSVAIRTLEETRNELAKRGIIDPDISKQRMQQIESRALARLRIALAEEFEYELDDDDYEEANMQMVKPTTDERGELQRALDAASDVLGFDAEEALGEGVEPIDVCRRHLVFYTLKRAVPEVPNMIIAGFTGWGTSTISLAVHRVRTATTDDFRSALVARLFARLDGDESVEPLDISPVMRAYRAGGRQQKKRSA